MNNEEQTQLEDLEKVSGFSKEIILRVCKEVVWLRETTCRRTPAVQGITRAQTDKEAIYYADGVTATLMVLYGNGLIMDHIEELACDTEFRSGGKGDYKASQDEEPFAEHAPKSASDFI